MTASTTADGMVLTISKDFRFEAAHRFTHESGDHPFARLHGHSFEGTVEVAGGTDERSGFVEDFWAIEEKLKTALEGFDHALLNDIPDLATPSLENIALTIFRRLTPELPGLIAVEIRRPSCGERARVTRSGS